MTTTTGPEPAQRYRNDMTAQRLLTSDDLDMIGVGTFGSTDPGDVTMLVDAVDNGGLADPGDAGYALSLAAEIAEKQEDIQTAFTLTERAATAEPGFAIANQAHLLLRMDRPEDAMARLTEIRPLLMEDPSAAIYITDALREAGRLDTAVRTTAQQ